MIWVLARGEGDAVEYWTGRFRHGEPEATPFWADAQKFHDAAAVNEAASTHRLLRYSDEWYAHQPGERSERRS